jgi:hypothetical protein
MTGETTSDWRERWSAHFDSLAPDDTFSYTRPAASVVDRLTVGGAQERPVSGDTSAVTLLTIRRPRGLAALRRR